MKRREFLNSAGLGLAVGSLAMPAIAQSNPEIRWRLTSAFPKSLDTLFGVSETFAKRVGEATDGRWQIQAFGSGEIVGTFQAFDAIANGTVEMGHTSAYYYLGKDPTFAAITSLPFGPNARQLTAWQYQGGGNELCNEYLAKYNVHAIPAGNTGAQMGGWFRKEIKTVADLQGLKFRIAGLAGEILQKLGVVPQQIAGGEVYPALERGTIDAAEWVGPYDDEKLGLYKVAPFYYYPGWWEGGPSTHLMFNMAKWNELPKRYQAIAQDAAMYGNTEMLAKYDARNPAALRRLVAAGAQLRPFSQEVMDACFKLSNELYDDISSKNPDFKKIWDSLRAFRNESYLWLQVAEFNYDSFLIRSRGRG